MSNHRLQEPAPTGTVRYRLQGWRNRSITWQRKTYGQWHIIATSGKGVRHRKDGSA